MTYSTTDEVNNLNRQVYLLEQKVDLMEQILQEIHDTLLLVEDVNGVNLIREKFLTHTNYLLVQLGEIADA